METLSGTLTERIDELVVASKTPLLSTSSTSLAIQELAARTEMLEQAIREIGLEVQKRSLQD